MLERLICCALSMFAVAATAQEPLVARTASRLSISLDEAPRGSWQLVDRAGNVCARGDLAGGATRLSVDKLPGYLDVSLVLRDAAGHEAGTHRLNGASRVSPLPKPSGAVTIYQVPIRTYFARGLGEGQTGRLRDFTTEALREIRELGVDYLWVTGVPEASSPANTDPDVVKGEAGSYYAVYDPWDVNPQIGTLDELTAFLDRAHALGMRVLIDLVPNHTARSPRTDVACKESLDFGKADDTTQFFSLDNNFFHIQNSTFRPPQLSPRIDGVDGVYDTDIFTDGVQLETPARVTGNNVASAQPRTYDWYETTKLNYGYDFTARRGFYNPRPRTWDQMVDVGNHWLNLGVDGFRVDMAHSVPIEFWRYFIAELKRTQPAVFLVGEAYEADAGMRVPGFSYETWFEAGADTVFNSELYGRLRKQGDQPGQMYATRLVETPAMRTAMMRNGFMFTNFMENHDEVRLASRAFGAGIGDRANRAQLGLALTGFAALLPAHVLVQGGQEVQEDASILGTYPGAPEGRTSIFDFVYQSETHKWLSGDRAPDIVDFRERYRRLLELKKGRPFNLPHTTAAPSYIDLHEANWQKAQSYWVAAYLRYEGRDAYLVVTNADPAESRETVIHFTTESGRDTLGALAAAGIVNDARARYRFTEVLTHPGWRPTDPNVEGEGLPGNALFRNGGVPSGLFLGRLDPASTHVFKIERIQ